MDSATGGGNLARQGAWCSLAGSDLSSYAEVKPWLYKSGLHVGLCSEAVFIGDCLHNHIPRIVGARDCFSLTLLQAVLLPRDNFVADHWL